MRMELEYGREAFQFCFAMMIIGFLDRSCLRRCDAFNSWRPEVRLDCSGKLRLDVTGLGELLKWGGTQSRYQGRRRGCDPGSRDEQLARHGGADYDARAVASFVEAAERLRMILGGGEPDAVGWTAVTLRWGPASKAFGPPKNKPYHHRKRRRRLPPARLIVVESPRMSATMHPSAGFNRSSVMC